MAVEFSEFIPWLVGISVTVIFGSIGAVLTSIKLSRDTKKDQRLVASELKNETEKIAEKVKTDTEEMVADKLRYLKTDIDRDMLVINNKIEATNNSNTEFMRSSIEILTNALNYKIEIVNGKLDLITQAAASLAKIVDKLDKRLDFMTQMNYGTTAKSDPPFLFGEAETKEHRDKPSEGIFSDTEEEKKREE